MDLFDRAGLSLRFDEIAYMEWLEYKDHHTSCEGLQRTAQRHAGLAIGMAAALLILTYVAFEYSYDDMHSRQDRIFRVEARFYENGELTDDWASSSAGYATAMKQNMSAVEAYTRVGS